MRIAFRFKPVPFAAMLVLVVLGIALGRWQDRRAAETLAIGARIEAASTLAPVVLRGDPVDEEAVRYRRVAVTGDFINDWPIYLDNRPHAGRAGFYVLMPFRIEASRRRILVLRGWLPRDAMDRQRIAPYPTPAGIVTIEGVALPDAGHVMQLGDAPPPRPGAIVQNADPAQVGAAANMRLYPFVLQQTSADGSEGALVRDWPRPDLGVDKHRGYAFQWYALALMAFLFYLFHGLRSASNSR